MKLIISPDEFNALVRPAVDKAFPMSSGRPITRIECARGYADVTIEFGEKPDSTEQEISK